MHINGVVLFKNFLAGDGSDEISADVEGTALHKMVGLLYLILSKM